MHESKIEFQPYTLLYVDPPWQYTDKNANGKRGACFKYPVMTLANLKALPVAKLAAEDSALAMWWVSPMPLEALEVVSAWGFTLKNMCAFTWHKLSKTGRRDHFGTGHYTRSNTENVLIATRGKPVVASKSVRGIVTAPVGAHSVKPAEVRKRLEVLFGDVQRVELFARERVAGWDSMGSGIDGKDITAAIEEKFTGMRQPDLFEVQNV